MAGVHPFRGVHYSSLSDLERLTAPPYDVISPDEQRALYDSSRWNIVRLELAQRDPAEPAEVFYGAIGRNLRTWLSDGVLTRDSRPAFYVYQQEFELNGGERRQRTGFFAEVALEEFDRDVILPHEETFAGPKEDRLQLLRACRANLSPIFGLYNGSRAISELLQGCTAGAPLASYQDRKGILNRLWRLEDTAANDVITKEMADRQVLIADGHHRYETALAYRRERSSHRGGWYDRALFCLVSMGDPGLVVLPTHRVIHADPAAPAGWQKRLPDGCVTRELSRDPASWDAALKSGQGCRFVVITRSDTCSVQLPDSRETGLKALDVYRLHHEVIPAITLIDDVHSLEVTYTHSSQEAGELVLNGKCPLAILMNPTPVEQVSAVASAGARMPEKSTYFYPKLSTGLVLRVEEETVES